MKCLLAVLLCVAAVVAEDPQGAYHGTVVCIDVRPNPHAGPTKVCGPLVSPQQQRPHQKSDPAVYNPPARQATDDSREAEQPPCVPKSPAYQTRQFQPQQPQVQQPFMPRRDLPQEGMMPMMPMMPMMDLDGWRQASPPCASGQRAAAPPMPYPLPMMAPQMPHQQPAPMAHSRTWLVNPQHPGMQRAAEEPPKPQVTQKSPEDGHPGPSPPTMESLETLLKECEEKTKLLQEKEKKITELKSQIGNKKEAEKQETKTSNETKQ